MEPIGVLPLQIALMKLEEELSFLRHAAFNIPPNLSQNEVYKLLHKGIGILKLGSQIFDFLENVENGDPLLKENAISSLFEAVFIVSTLFKNLKPYTPLFWEDITVFTEPVLLKLEQLNKTLYDYLDTSTQDIDYDELGFVLDEIAKTLEAALLLSRKIHSLTL